MAAFIWSHLEALSIQNLFFKGDLSKEDSKIIIATQYIEAPSMAPGCIPYKLKSSTIF